MFYNFFVLICIDLDKVVEVTGFFIGVKVLSPVIYKS